MRKLTLVAAMAIMTLGVAGTAQAQQHNGGHNGVIIQQRGGGEHRGGDFRGGDFRGGEHRGGDFRGGEIRGGERRDYDRHDFDRRDFDRRDFDRRDYDRRDYGRRDYGRDYRGWGWGRGGIDIIIGGGRYGYPPYGYPGDYGYPSTRIIWETVQERVYDPYQGWVFTGRTYQVSHVATWDNYYRGYVWYDSNGQLRVN